MTTRRPAPLEARRRGFDLADVPRVSEPTIRVFRAVAGDDWGFAVIGASDAIVHVVAAGSAWVNAGAYGWRRMEAGDVVWLPPETPHRLAARTDAPARRCAHATASAAEARGGDVRLGRGPHRTTLLSLIYRPQEGREPGALAGLGEALHLSAQSNPALRTAVRLLNGELSGEALGSATAISSLLDLLLVYLSREAVETACAPSEHRGENRHADDIASEALRLVRLDPDRVWTADSLANALNVSRSTLHRHFVGAIGDSPRSYLTRWRMNRAALLLRESSRSVAEIARETGYASAHAFARAFVREHAETPRIYRRRSRGLLAPEDTAETVG